MLVMVMVMKKMWMIATFENFGNADMDIEGDFHSFQYVVIMGVCVCVGGGG